MTFGQRWQQPEQQCKLSRANAWSKVAVRRSGFLGFLNLVWDFLLIRSARWSNLFLVLLDIPICVGRELT